MALHRGKLRNEKALITGLTGQDGSYLAEFLLEKSYAVYGVVRRTSTLNFSRLEHVMDDITILHADLLDQNSLMQAIEESEPDEVYNLAAQSVVPTSWSQPVLTGEFTALGVTRILEAIRRQKPDARFVSVKTYPPAALVDEGATSAPSAARHSGWSRRGDAGATGPNPRLRA